MAVGLEMGALELVTTAEDEQFFWISLGRPEAHHALDAGMLRDLHAALDEADRSPRGTMLGLRADGAHFCAGMDLVAAVGTGSAVPAGGAPHPYWALLERLASMDRVSVALVDGKAIGGGVGLAAACDIVLATPNARFRLTEILFGLMPAMVLPFLARRTGLARAFRLALTADELDPRAALDCGLADLLATPSTGDAGGDDRDALVRGLRQRLRRLDRRAVAALKAYRNEVSPLSSLGPLAANALGKRLDDPSVQANLRRFTEEGVLPWQK